MEITEVKIRKITDESRMKAIVSVTFDNELVIHDIKVISADGKTFLAMPSRRLPDGRFSDITHPVGRAFREKLETAVLAEFEKALSREQADLNS